MTQKQKFIPQSELNRLTIGSMEEQIGLIREALNTHLGEEGWTLISTYPDHVVCMCDSKFYKINVENKDGEQRLGALEELDVNVVGENDLREYVMQEAGQAVDAFMAGADDVALDKIKQLFSIPEVTNVRTSDRIEEAVVMHLQASHDWMERFAERETAIRTFLGDRVKVVEQNVDDLRRKLDDEEEAVGCLSNYGLGLVRALDEAVETFNVLGKKLTSSATYRMYEGFAMDLFQDIRKLQELLSEPGFRTGSRTPPKVYATVVEEFIPRAIAVEFVCAIANRLRTDEA
jgi:hypothetical protein